MGRAHEAPVLIVLLFLSITLGQTCLPKRLFGGDQRLVRYSAADKVKIVFAMDTMMAEKNLNQKQAAAVLQVSPSHILRWRAKSSSGEQAARPNTLALHQGPASFLFEVKEQLVDLLMSGMAREFLYLVYLLSERRAC